MRFRHRDGTAVHLAYCTNVHPAEDLDGVLDQLAGYGEPIRERLGADRIGLGLWLAAPVVARLVAEPAAVERLRDELGRRGLEVVTLNAFPYRHFQRPVVKHAVYLPDWTQRERLDYTLDCARVLAALLPDDARRGSISTLPLSWRSPWSAERADAARSNLDALAVGLARIAADTGRTVRVGLEPEPGCVAETVAEAAALLSTVDGDWVGVCLDACHAAVAFEDPVALAGPPTPAAGPAVVKAQVSCAVHADRPGDPETRAALAAFVEPRFLHQTREPGQSTVDDLPDALAGRLPAAAPWRIHFHVPLHAELAHPLRTTRPELLRTLDALLAGDRALTDHLEVETYTWPVLPEAGGGANDLIRGIADELDWARRALAALGLTEESA